MDIFSHGLWTGALAKGASFKNIFKNPFKIKWAVIWGILPDIFAFTPLFAYMLFGLIFRGINLADLPKPDAAEPPPQGTLWIFELSTSLYNLSHSLLVFLMVFGVIFLVRRGPVWEMLGWLFHILIDIPTHSYQFYPTPFLWPLSQWKFDGISWGAPWFMAANYAALGAVYYWLWQHGKKERAIS